MKLLPIILFTLKTIPQRKGSALAAAVGIAGVVAVLVGVLSIAEGFKQAMQAGGADDVAIVLRAGADNEMSSGLSREEVRILSDSPGIARGPQGALTSAELFVIIDLPKRNTGTSANVPLRGVDPKAFEVRGNINLIAGRHFESGKNEIIVGSGAHAAFSGLDLGESIRIGANTWTVVGIFTADGGAAETEVWTDAAVLQPAYNRGETFQSIYVRLASAGAFHQFSSYLANEAASTLKTKTMRLSEFYSEQSTMLSDFITNVGTFIAGMMALGALFGALNTMYGAVATRTREIATLRALGFTSFPIVISVLVESLALAIIGGSLGAAISYFTLNGMQTTTMNWQTFSQVSFAFAVTPALLIKAIIWAAIIGVFGGLFPAIRAARLPIATGLREVN